MFKALLLEKNDNFQASLQSVSVEQLPPGDVTVAVAYSTLNFKDGLAICNRSPV
ncbi:MAG: oxidoreductase, partial [Limnohabitans sp.]